MICPEASGCHHYANGTRARDEYYRRAVPCRHWVDEDCDLGLLKQQGPACNIEKIRGIKKRLIG